MSNQIYDVIVIGAGPAGLFSSRILDKKGLKVLLLEQGSNVAHRVCVKKEKCQNCYTCAETSGIGGVGGYSDGKLCLGPVGIDDELLGDSYLSESAEIEHIFAENLGDRIIYPQSKNFFMQKNNFTEESTRVIKLGSNNVRFAFQKIFDELTVEKSILTRVNSIHKASDLFLVKTQNKVFSTKYVVLATGKSDLLLKNTILQEFCINSEIGYPCVGVRIEVPRIQAKLLEETAENLKIKMKFSKGYVKTHCFCSAGEVISYKSNGNLLIGGRSNSDQSSSFTNVAILYKCIDNDLKHEALLSLRAISKLYPHNTFFESIASFVGKKQERLKVIPLSSSIPYEIGKLFPDEISSALKTFILNLEKEKYIDLTGGIVHAPCSEWTTPKIITSFVGETTHNLFYVGDGSGRTQGIVAAAIMGQRAARTILEREQKNGR